MNSGRLFIESSLPKEHDFEVPKRAKTESPSLMKATAAEPIDSKRVESPTPVAVPASAPASTRGSTSIPAESEAAKEVKELTEKVVAEDQDTKTPPQNDLTRPKSTPATVLNEKKEDSVAKPRVQVEKTSRPNVAAASSAPPVPSKSTQGAREEKKISAQKHQQIALRKNEPTNPTAIDFNEDKRSDVMVFLVPNRLPEPPQSRNPLAELYYTTQTLPISKILPSAHKTLSTDSYQLSLLEGKLAVVHTRIEELKRSQMWSLRQHAKFKAPLRPKTHWDHLLDEMRWLQMDFKEERKLKIAVCNEISKAVIDYWTFGKEACCVKVKPPKFLEPQKDSDGDEEMKVIDDSEEEKEKGKEDEEVKREESADKETKEGPETVDPSNLSVSASAEREEVATVNNSSPSFHNSLIPTKPEIREDGPSSNSPFKMYMSYDTLNSASKEVFDLLPQVSTFNPNAPYLNEFDSLSLTSVTKFLAAPDLGRGWQRLVIDVKRKESDHEHLPVLSSLSDKYDDGREVTVPSSGPLFGREAHRRAHLVKAPQPPNVKYLEYRTPTMWLPQDDAKLLKLAKDYAYNWNVIAMHMLPYPTMGYTSNIERRTAWQCFERWYQLNPTFNLSDLRGPYAQAAQMWFEAASKAQANSKRRLFPLGVGPESVQRGHRRLRWASMFDGMRKSMRKRENLPKPNSNAVQRKSNLGDASKSNIPSPHDLTKLKFERDKSLAEMYQQQQKNAVAGLNNTNTAPVPNNNNNNNSNNNNSTGNGNGNGNSNNNNSNIANNKTAVNAAGAANNRAGAAATANGSQARQQVPNAAAAGGYAKFSNQNTVRPAPVGGVNSQSTVQQVPTSQGQAPLTPQQQQAYLERQRQALLQQRSVQPGQSGQPTPQNNGSTQMPQNTAGVRPLNNQQMQNLINQVRQQNPGISVEQATKIAHNQVLKYMQLKQQQQQQKVFQQQPQSQPQSPQPQPQQAQPSTSQSYPRQSTPQNTNTPGPTR